MSVFFPRKILVLLFPLSSFLYGYGQNFGNGLPATDALGRHLPMYNEVGTPKTDKKVGLFYWTWHTDNLADFSPVLNITEILDQYPEAERDAAHPAWQGIEGGVFWWDEPLFGYYRTTDEWVLRKHAEMLADAGVDVVFFDCTNGSFTWKSSYTKLLEVWSQAREDGVQTPQIAFLLPFGPTDGAMSSLNELYDDLYQPGLYKDLWFLWQEKPLIMAYPDCMKVQRNSAGLKFAATAPFFAINATCPSWGNNVGNLTFRLYKWNNTYEQTVAGTPIIEKTFENFNDNAKLQLTFNKQEAGTYLWELCNGTETVGVWKYNETNGSSVSYYNSAQVSGNYESEIAYSSGLTFTKLTTGSSHSPVQIYQLIDRQKVDAIQSFFTFRPGQPDYVNGPANNTQWAWLEVYPQHGFGSTDNGGYEQVAVGVAQNASDATGGHCGGFNTDGTYGRSYTRENGQDSRPDSYYYGLNFQEQWNRALDLNPELVFVTGWNEWTAGRWFDWDIKPFAFVDQYSAEKSRDIEPVKSWGSKGDLYYLQLISNIRKYKGTDKEVAAGGPMQIDLNDISGFSNVQPEFLSYKGNTIHRNHAGQGTNLFYNNSTGRNDIVKAKVAYDQDYIFFYVETADALTPKSDEKWMRLFIDFDRNKSTGWEGYDFLINRYNTGDSAKVEKSENSWQWSQIGSAKYVIEDSVLVVKVNRSLLNVSDDSALDFEFKWSDNMQDDGNIMDFYVNGDVAPSGRFNYHYFTETVTRVKDEPVSLFKIYPNPAKDRLWVTFETAAQCSNMAIYDIQGNLLWQKKFDSAVSSYEIDLEAITTKGFYILEAQTQRGYQREKFIRY